MTTPPQKISFNHPLSSTESEERFRILVTATPDIVYRMSPDWSRMYTLDTGACYWILICRTRNG